MRIFDYSSMFFIFIILNSVYIIHADAFPGTNGSKTLLNINQGNITLFTQNYSEIDNVPDNVFIAKVTNSTNTKFDLLYSIVYGTHNSKVVFNNTSHMFTYTTTRESSPSISSLFPALEKIFDFVLSKYGEYYWKNSEKYNFCKSTSLPISGCYRQPIQSGSLYISRLVPMVKSTYQISMNMRTDSPDSFIEITSPGSKLIIQEIDNNMVLKSYYKNSAGDMNYKIISIGNATEILK